MNSSDFKRFKLYHDSVLKTMNKDELIKYIHILHNNWSATDEQLCNVIENNKSLQSKLNWFDHEFLDK